MKNDRLANHAADLEETPPGNAWTRFWFAPMPTTGMHCLRVLSGLLFLSWLLVFLGHQQAFFSLSGWLDLDGFLELQRKQSPTTPVIGWSILHMAGDSSAGFQALYWASLAVLALFTLGVATRVTSVLTWVIVVSFLSNPATTYEAEYLLGILAFYLMIGHVLAGQWHGNLSTAERILGARRDFLFARWIFGPSDQPAPPSSAANLMMRLLQIHTAIIIVTSGLQKLQSGDWWSGAALWYPLHNPFQTSVESLRVEAPDFLTRLFYLSFVQYLVLAWQIAFPAFAWRPGWGRVLLLGGAACYWTGVAYLFQLPLFGPFVFLGCLSFLQPAEWAWLRQQLRWHANAENAATVEKTVAVAAGQDSSN